MAGSKSDLVELEVLRILTGQALATLSLPITPWIALFSVVPDDTSGGGTEITGSGQSRQNASGKFGTPSAGSVALSAAVDFPTVTGSSITVVGIACYDASTSGNRLWWADVTSQTVNVGNFYRLPASTGITITEA